MEQVKTAPPIVDSMAITLGDQQEGTKLAVRYAGEAIQRLSVRMRREGTEAHVPGLRDAYGRLTDVLRSVDDALVAGNRELSKVSAEKLAAALPAILLALFLLPGAARADIVHSPTPTLTPTFEIPTKTPPAVTETKTPPPTNSPVPTETKVPPTKEPTPTWTPTSSPTPTNTLTATVVPSSSPSTTPSQTVTASPSSSPTPTASPSKTVTPRPDPSPTPFTEPSPTPTAPPSTPVPLDGRALGALAAGLALVAVFVMRRAS